MSDLEHMKWQHSGLMCSFHLMSDLNVHVFHFILYNDDLEFLICSHLKVGSKL